MTTNMYIATCAWLLILLGYIKRKQRAKHVPLMLSGIGIDISLVLYLQLTRDAIQTAVGFTLTLFKQLHILSSTVALLLYFPVLYLGFKLVRKSATPNQRSLHLRLGKAALIFRTLGFFLMFSMWKS